MTQKIQQFWDKNAIRYDDSQRKSESIHRKILEKSYKYFDLQDHVLDFGCATGTLTIELAKKVKHIHGIDISPGMIGLAKKKKDASAIPSISFSPGTIFSKELTPASFDKIVSIAVIHLLEDKEDVIRRIHELLKPGGLFISVTPCFKDKMDFKNRLALTTTRLMQKLGLLPLHLNRFTFTDVGNLMIAHDFKIVESERMFDGMTICFAVAKKE